MKYIILKNCIKLVFKSAKVKNVKIFKKMQMYKAHPKNPELFDMVRFEAVSAFIEAQRNVTFFTISVCFQ